MVLPAWIAFACLLGARRLLGVRRPAALLLAGAVVVGFGGLQPRRRSSVMEPGERRALGVPGACTEADLALFAAVDAPLMRLGRPRGEDDGASVLLLQSPTADEQAAMANTGAALRRAGWVPTGATSFVRQGVVMGMSMMEMSTLSHDGVTVRLALP